jgi:hypothetical protein
MGKVPPAQPPRVRAQNDDVPPAPMAAAATAATKQPATLTLPSPEQLGVSTAKIAAYPTAQPENVDWNAVHAHLRRLGAIGFQLMRGEGQVRVTFLLPTSQPDRAQRIETTAATDAQAVQLALAQAEQSSKQR